MTLEEIVGRATTQFQVVEEAGFPQHYFQDGKVVGDAGRDMNKAPNGEKYVVMTSSGVHVSGDTPSVFFTSDKFAADWYRYSLEDYAESVAPKDEWGSLYLYWREKPEIRQQNYISEDQSQIMRTTPEMSPFFRLTLGIVWSRLLISKIGPI